MVFPRISPGSSLDPSDSLSAAGLHHGDQLSAVVQPPRMAATASWTHGIRWMNGCGDRFPCGYPLVNIQKAIENGHRNSGFTH